MKSYIWQDRGAGEVDEAIMEFTAGEDVILDRELFPHDIRATAAHVRGLARIGIMKESEASRLCELLNDLLDEFRDLLDTAVGTNQGKTLHKDGK